MEAGEYIALLVLALVHIALIVVNERGYGRVMVNSTAATAELAEVVEDEWRGGYIDRQIKLKKEIEKRKRKKEKWNEFNSGCLNFLCLADGRR